MDKVVIGGVHYKIAQQPRKELTAVSTPYVPEHMQARLTRCKKYILCDGYPHFIIDDLGTPIQINIEHCAYLDQYAWDTHY